MKAATISEIKKELKDHSPEEIMELCLRLARFKKENKELLTYLLYESSDDYSYIETVKADIDLQFKEINTANYYWMKKSIRKILRNTKKRIRYTQKKNVEVELLIYFCTKMKEIKPSISQNLTLQNIFERQIVAVKKTISTMEEDLQYDYNILLLNLQ